MPKFRALSLMAQETSQFQPLLDAGFEVLLNPDNVSPFDEGNLIELLKDCDAVNAGSEPYTPRVLEANPQLRHIARSGVGFDAVDLDYCNEHGIIVTTTPGVNHHAVAELAVTMVMALGRGFPGHHENTRSLAWSRAPLPRIMGSTIGIIGLGRIGRAVATRAVGLGMKVLAFEPYPNNEFIEQWNIELADFDDVLGRSDYVTLHSPSTPETYHLMNADTLAKMKPGSVLVNTARGSLIDEKALIQALDSGPLRGAGLDVFEVEPVEADNPLLKMDNVLVSPHVGGLDQQSDEDTFEMLSNTVLDLYSARRWPVECIINRKEANGWTW